MINSTGDAKKTEVYAGLQVRRQIASLKKRALAAVTDFCILTLIIYLYIFVVGFIVVFGVIGVSRLQDLVNNVGFEDPGFGAIGILLVALAAFLGIFAIFHGYFISYEYKEGRTPGKKIFGLTVQDANGRPLTLSQAVMRDFLRYVDFGLYVLPIPGILAANSSDRNQRLGDLAAGTIVTHSASEENKRNFIYMQPDSYFRIYEQVAPKPIEPQRAKEILSIAFPSFIMRTRSVDETEQNFLLKVMEYYLPAATELGLSQHQQVVFLYEYCNQRSIMAA